MARRFTAEGELPREAQGRLAEVVAIGDEPGVSAQEDIEDPDGEALRRGALEDEIARGATDAHDAVGLIEAADDWTSAPVSSPRPPPPATAARAGRGLK